MTEKEAQIFALRLLDEKPMTTRELSAELAEREPNEFTEGAASATIESLHNAKLVVRVNGKLAITQAGKELASLIGLRAEPPRVDRLTGDFYAPELGRTCLRPGAYDFMDKPSLVVGKRVPYRYAK